MSYTQNNNNDKEEYTYTYIRVRIPKSIPSETIKCRTKEDAVRLAAIIDCDGCVGVYRQGVNTVPRITISSKERSFLEKIREVVGFGSIQKAGKNGAYYELVWQCRQALAIAKFIIHHSWVKKERLKKILDFYGEKDYE